MFDPSLTRRVKSSLDGTWGPLECKQPSPALIDRLASTADSRHDAIRATRQGHRIRVYDKNSWVKVIFSPYGRNFTSILKPMLLVTVSACVATPLIMKHKVDNELHAFCSEHVRSMESALGYVIIGLTFLLVFRLNRAALRHYEARQLWGVLITACIDIVLQSNVALPDKPASRDGLCAMAVSFPVCLMWHMWAMADPTAFDEKRYRAMLEGLFEEETMRTLVVSKCRPQVLIQMALLQLESSFVGLPDTPGEAQQYSELQGLIRGLSLTMGGCERIQGTPLPYVYFAHVRSFLVIVLVGMPIIYACDWEWATIPLSILVAFALLGIEAASVECEQPFAANPSKNHHDVETLAVIVSTRAQELLGVANSINNRTRGKAILMA